MASLSSGSPRSEMELSDHRAGAAISAICFSAVVRSSRAVLIAEGIPPSLYLVII